MASEPAFYMNHRRFAAIALIAAIGITPADAYAYLDPGTGSQLLQILAAGLLTALFFIKTIWRLILGWFSSWFKPKSESSSTDKQAPQDIASDEPDKRDSNSDD